MKAQRGSRRIALRILNVDARWGWVVNATLLPHRLTPGKEHRYPLYRRLDGPQNRYGGVNIFPHRGSNPDCPVRSESLH